MFQRHMMPVLAARAREMPVVTVTGPRQSGKTTLVRAAFPSHAYVTVEEPDERARALADPRGFLARYRDGLILDEVQRAPELLSYIQADVDRDDTPGRYVLTGSQNLTLLAGVSQTLAGRTAILHLLPLSLGELSGRGPLVPESLDSAGAVGDAPPRACWPTVWAGFYPRIHDKALSPDRWLADYHRTYVERDLREVLRVLDLDAFERFVRLAAARTGQELNLSDIAADAGVTQPTARQWLTALRVGFLVTVLPPHHASFRKRLRKRPRLHFVDTGLACYLLGIHSPEVLERHPLRGAIFESYVVSELTKAFENAGRDPPLFHWRDATGHEIDVVMDLGERLVPIEVKSGATVAPDALAGLRFWTGLPGNPARGGVLVHGGTGSYDLGGVAVKPWWLG